MMYIERYLEWVDYCDLIRTEQEAKDARLIKKWATAFFASNHPKIRLTSDEDILYGDCFVKADSPLQAGSNPEFSMGTKVPYEPCPACEAGIPKKQYISIETDESMPPGHMVVDDDFRLICISLVKEPIDRNAVIKFSVPCAPEHGATCVKCKQNYPDADRRADFKCWACRNGY